MRIRYFDDIYMHLLQANDVIKSMHLLPVLQVGQELTTESYTTRKFLTMENNLQTTKLELIQWLSTIDSPTIIEKLLAIQNSEKEAYWERLSAAEKESITKGIDDADAGKLKDHDQVRKIYAKWL